MLFTILMPTSFIGMLQFLYRSPNPVENRTSTLRIKFSRVTKIEVMEFYIFFCFVARNRTLLCILYQRAILSFFLFSFQNTSRFIPQRKNDVNTFGQPIQAP
mgnify:CR=1 FL=1